MKGEKRKGGRSPWNRWTIFGVMALTYFLVYFHRVSPAVLATDLQGSFGVGLTAVAILSSAYFYA